MRCASIPEDILIGSLYSNTSIAWIICLSYSFTQIPAVGVSCPYSYILCLGCGKISAALCRGFAGADGIHKPRRIIVSRRNEEKSSKLLSEFPDLVTIEDDNARLVADSDIILIGLLPTVARTIIPEIAFQSNKMVISMVSHAMNQSRHDV